LFTKEIDNDVGKVKKTQNIFEAQAVHDPLVSERQKLCEPGRQKDQPAADAAPDGPQGRMAPLNSLILHKQPFWLCRKSEIRKASLGVYVPR